MNIQNFIDKYSLRLAKVEETDKNPNMEEWREAYHWKMTVTGLNGKAFRTYFSTGLGWTKAPDLPDLLTCLALDFQSIDGNTFEDWQRDLGFEDEESAKRIYKTIQRQASRFKAFVGDKAFADFLTVSEDDN